MPSLAASMIRARSVFCERTITGRLARRVFAEACQNLEPVHGGHGQIQQEKVGRVAERGEGFGAVAGQPDAVAGSAEHQFKGFAEDGFVVGNQDGFHRGRLVGASATRTGDRRTGRRR